MPWIEQPRLITPRYRHVATRLADGRVLVTGGLGKEDALADAEVYDPAHQAWTKAAPMKQARLEHTATLLADGRVLVVGGETEAGLDVTAHVEIYDPGTNAWTVAVRYPKPIRRHAAVLLEDGQVLVVGGDNRQANAPSCCRFDPKAGTWSRGPKTGTEREKAAAARLADGSVLLVSGNSAERLAPGGTWAPGGSSSLAREACAVLPLPDGGALIAGDHAGVERWRAGELGAAGTAAWAREGWRFVAAADGTIVAVGAQRPYVQLGVTERWDPVSASFVELDPVPVPVNRAAACAVGARGVLLCGGLILGYPSDMVWTLEPVAAAARSAPSEVRLIGFPRPFAPVLTFWQTWSTESMTEARLLEQWQRRAAGARELFETSPVMVRRSFPPDELERLMADCEAAGATVLIS